MRISNFRAIFQFGLLVTVTIGSMVIATGCGDAGVENLTDYSQGTTSAVVTGTPKVDWVAEEAPPIDTALLAKLMPCDGFDFPVGPPDAKTYFKARGFLPKDLEHLGEDWNGAGGGNTDFGDYVYAAATGVVIFSKFVGPGWGNVIRLLHNYGTRDAPRYIETFYAHVSTSWVRPGYVMKRGEVIGTIGNADGKYHAHLHFEARTKPGKEVGCGYAGDTLGFVDPTAFIEAHRPLKKL